MSYAYNGKGEQVRRSNASTDTIAMYDEAGHWLGEYDASLGGGLLADCRIAIPQSAYKLCMAAGFGATVCGGNLQNLVMRAP